MDVKPTILTVDDAISRIKPLTGWYQIFMAILYAWNVCLSSVNIGFMSFGGLMPEWSCPSLNQTQPTDDCDIWQRCPETDLIYHMDFYSIRAEWGLVCEKRYYSRLISTIQMLGVTIGAFIYGHAADHWGRKWTTIVIKLFQICVGALSALASDWQTFAIFRFFIGFSVGCEIVVSWVFLAECVTNKERYLIRCITASPLIYMSNMNIVAYLTKDWRLYSIWGNLHHLPIALLLMFFTYESPHWLLQKRKTQQAIDVLRKIAKFNRCSENLPEDFELDEPSAKQKDRYYFYHLFTHGKKLLRYTLVNIYMWYVVGLIFFALWLNIGNLAGANVYLGTLLFGFISSVSIPIGILDYKCPKFLDRRRILLAVLSMATIANMGIVILISTGLNTAVPISLTILSVIGQLGASLGFDLGYVYAIELFPTLLRSIANAASNASSRVGSMVAPQMLYLSTFWAPLPYAAFSIFALISVILVYFVLPDTKHMELPEEVIKEIDSHNSLKTKKESQKFLNA